MAIEFRGISHSYSVEPVLESLSVSAQAGQITCLLGASGSGKSTLLRLAAGLERVQAGSIWLDGELLADANHHPPPEARPIGLVFQDHVLFPHKTVRANVAFGVRENGVAVDQALEGVGLAGFGGRFPDTLSGGQQQRVALARALAPQPAVVLLDEPFASIDATLRRQLREATRSALKAANNVAIIVTHDPEEALELADRIVVIEAGRVVQEGEPAELWSNPASVGVAMLFGQAQRLNGRVTADGIETSFGILPADDDLVGDVDVVVRPEALELEVDASSPVVVDDVRFLGRRALVVIESGGERLRASIEEMPSELVVGSTVGVTMDVDETFVFAPDDA